MRVYRAVSMIFVALFAITGILFLGIPDKVIAFFNSFSSFFGMPESPANGGRNIYLILAVGYMYLVTLLAFLMFKHPENRYFALLLANAKIASSILSLAFFLLDAQYLIYLSNFIIDGLIGLVALVLYLVMRKTEWAYS